MSPHFPRIPSAFPLPLAHRAQQQPAASHFVVNLQQSIATIRSIACVVRMAQVLLRLKVALQSNLDSFSG